uniref:Peptidase M15A C-terminal domain-containing protein n=1 Tax=uncultured prokaryote TaxID=198431 RepID=A0A0H5QKX7_9ZZZZ|nr:hypothetical protein [uncultured prokaryote]
MGDLSEHFSRSEFRCRHCGAYKAVSPDLIRVLERIRALSAEPLVIVSGYRCAVHNRAVGGASQSQHLYGTAADIGQGRATLHQARAAGARGVGTRGRWAVHVDVRAGRPASWSY